MQFVPRPRAASLMPLVDGASAGDGDARAVALPLPLEATRPHRSLGPFEAVSNRGDRATAPNRE